jgi:DNA (cytosine-5)-methyltransferase 1
VNTKDYGVPQNRERIFLIGFLNHEAYLRFSFAPKQKLEKRLKDVLEDYIDEKYYLKDSVIAQFTEKTERAKREGNGFAFKPSNGDNIAYSITTKAGGRLDDNFIDVIGLLECKGTDQIRRVYGVDGIAATLTTMQGGNQEPKILEKCIRKLTPLECWRLQDFPDEAHNKAKAAGVSDSQLYKQAGNSMSVNVLEMIFRQILNGKNSDLLF